MMNKAFALCTAITSYCSGVNCRDSRIFSRLYYASRRRHVHFLIQPALSQKTAPPRRSSA
nr:MAG TPA: hypothetical protein [Caudoviricetes sp.]